MPCLASTNSGGGQSLPPLPTKWPSSQAEWTLFIQRAQARDQAIASGLISLGVNVIPSPLTVFDAITVPPSRVTGATAALSSTARFGTSSLRLTATAATVVLTLGTSGYPIPIAPNGQWIGSVYVQTSATVLAGTFGIVTPAGTYNQNIGDSVQANMWNRLYDTFNLQVDASTSCTVTLTFTGCTVGQTIDLEGFMLETTDGYKMLPSVFQVSSPPRTWTDIPDPGTKPANNADVTAANTAMDTANVAGTPAATVVNTANAANANTPSVINPQFVNGLSGWSPGYAGWTVQTGGSNLPDPIVNTAAVHTAGTGIASLDTMYNSGHIPVVVGQQVIVTCTVQEVGVNAGALGYARISWRDASNAEITTSAPNGTAQQPTCGAAGTGTYAHCVTKVIAAAPANAQYAVAEPAISNHTAGQFLFSNVCMVAQPSNVGEVPDGGGRYAVHQVDSNGLALVDFSQAGHVNKNLDNIGDGPTFGRVYGTDLTGNRMDFSKGLLNKQLDNMPDGATFFRSTLPTGTGSAWSIDNATFQIPTLAGAIPAWSPVSPAACYYQSSGPAPYIGGQYLVLSNGATSGPGVLSVKKFYVTPGDSISFLADIYAVSGQAQVQLAFYNASGTYISGIYATSTNGSAWVRARSSGIVPAGSSYALIALQSTVANGYACFNSVVVTVNDIRVAGSGARVGDQRNLLQRTITNYPAKVPASITYSSTTTSATISIAAFTVLAGSVSVSYNAMSVSTSGTAGTTVTYYLYFNDPAYAGGTQTLIATTNGNDLYGGDGFVYCSSVNVTYPASGTGGGGGAPPVCVSVDAWVICRARGLMQAGGISEGDELRLVNPATGTERWGKVTMSKSAPAECVRVITASGTALTCSTTAPLGTQTGQVLAPDAIGALLAERCYGEFGHSLGVAVEPMGKRMVQHITCENDFFLAGDDPGCLLAHHNLKP